VSQVEDPARRLYTSLVAEPYRTKVVERLRLPGRREREVILAEAFYSPAYLNASDVYIDLATDSGTGAMSDTQWAALMRGDEAYVRSRSYLAFAEAVREVTGFRHAVPTHQGRAAEHIMMELLVKPGQLVLSNTHFDTTKAHVENRGATPIDLVGDWLWRFREPHPFKGNFDLAKLNAALERHHERVAMVVITVLNNFACSSPVSMENIREVSRLAARWDKPVFFDACRFAENAYFIKTREPGYGAKTIGEIVHEMMSYGRGCWMSAKKDAIVNIGGFIATDDEALAQRCNERLVLYEGFCTYGGLARRDLEAMAVGLREGIEEEYLAHRTGLVAFLGEQIEAAGGVVSLPVGGSGVFVDVEALYPHLAPEALPGIALSADLYLEGGVRAGAAPFPMHTVSPETGEIVDRMFQFARFAVPRRVYSRAHMEYVGRVFGLVKQGAPQNLGYEVTFMPEVLGHFFAKFKPRQR
jgi:tryptophanase